MNKRELITLTKEIAKREIDREYESLDVIADWCSDVIKAIKKEVPIKPSGKYPVGFETTLVGNCICGKEVNSHSTYCHHCGQRLDWSEDKKRTTTFIGGQLDANKLEETLFDQKIKFQKYMIDNDFVIESELEGKDK